MRRTLMTACLLSCCWTGLAHAQPVPSREPESTHIFPAGGRRGTTVAVRVGTQCFPPLARWQISGAGVEAISLLTQEAPGHYEPSPRRDPGEEPISCSREWESSVAISPDAPLGVRLWHMASARGGSARRPFVVGDLPEFIERESNSSPQRAECVALPVTINGQIAGERDLDFYRFTARAGQTVTCELAAARLGSPLDPVVELRDARGGRVSVVERRSGGGDPTLTMQTADGGDYVLMISNLASYGGPECVYRATLTCEQTPPSSPVAAAEWENDKPEQAGLSSLPLTTTAAFERPGDSDWFRFDLLNGAALSIVCEPHPPGAPTLPRLELFDSQRKPLLQGSSVDGARRQARLEYAAPAPGSVFLRASDVQQASRGGVEFTYRLSAAVDDPDFELSLPVDHANVLPASSSALAVSVVRSGGLTEPIELTVEGLPEGVKTEPAAIAAGQTTVNLSLTAVDGAGPSSSLIRIVGRARRGERTIERIAQARHAGCDADGVSLASPTVGDLHLVVQHPPVFRLFCQEAYQYARRGSIHEYQMEIERLPGFQGAVTLQIGDRQNRDLDGIEMLETLLQPGESQIAMPIHMPESMHVNVQSQSQLYVQGYALFTDRWGDRQSLLVVSEKRNILRTLPPVVKLKALDKELTLRAGAAAECRLQLERTPNFSGPMHLELRDPPPGIALAPCDIAAEQSQIAARLQVDERCVLPKGGTLVVRALGRLPDGVRVVTEATVKLVRE